MFLIKQTNIDRLFVIEYTCVIKTMCYKTTIVVKPNDISSDSPKIKVRKSVVATKKNEVKL